MRKKKTTQLDKEGKKNKKHLTHFVEHIFKKMLLFSFVLFNLYYVLVKNCRS